MNGRVLYTAFDVVPRPKGASTHILQFLRALVSGGYQVHLVTPNDGTLPAEDTLEGARVSRLPLVGEGNYLDRANLRPVPARHIHSAGIRMGVGGNLEVTLEAKNLLDDQVADLWGYPLPGRAYFVTLKHSRRK